MRMDLCELPDGRKHPGYYVMEIAPWVNVIPVTHDGQIVLIDQYRHAAGEHFLEIPGGMIDPDESDPKRAALRELEEETGFVPEDIRLIGSHFPNPATQDNQLYTFVALGCRQSKEMSLDAYEDIQVLTKSVPETIQLAMDGKIRHSLILASLFKALPFLGFNLP